MVKYELGHAVRCARPISENLQTNHISKIVVREVTREVCQETLPDMGKIREGTVLELVGTENTVGEGEDVTMN